jgi:hypothetical protein
LATDSFSCVGWQATRRRIRARAEIKRFFMEGDYKKSGYQAKCLATTSHCLLIFRR